MEELESHVPRMRIHQVRRKLACWLAVAGVFQPTKATASVTPLSS
ncbi:MAG: hypothetical protein WAM66_00040 [Acidobacteriaceae bacterium]